MRLSLFKYRFSALATLILLSNTFAWANNSSSTIVMNAVISNKGVGCEMTLPQTLLRFKPLQDTQLKGMVQAYEIKPLVVKLYCVNETQAIKPKLTLQGVTPYSSDTYQTVFLDGTPNGAGFMVRQTTDDKSISLTDFYRPEAAIGNIKTRVSLNELNNDNQYQSEATLWVGVVGPFQSNIIAGYFHASLIINVAFE